MFSATVLAIMLVPVFFVLVLRLFKVKRLNHAETLKVDELHTATGA
jgi:hypothetical protein